MKIILLAGGSAERMWPHNQSPKQFSFSDGTHSLLQKTLLRFLRLCNPQDLLVVTQKEYLQEAVRQTMEVAPEAQVIAEPEKKSTAAAVLFALSWLEKETFEAFLVAPTDHLISPESVFLEKIQTAQRQQCQVLFGAFPTHPHTGYGYITCDPEKEISPVESFIEKPPLPRAQTLLEAGRCLWNTGIVLFHKETFFKDLEKHQPNQNLSLDHAFLECFDSLKVMKLPLSWSDVGSWEGIYEVLEKDDDQNVKRGDILALDSKRCLILGEKRKIVAIDLEDLMIVDSEEGLLIAKRGSSQKLRVLSSRLLPRKLGSSTLSLFDE